MQELEENPLRKIIGGKITAVEYGVDDIIIEVKMRKKIMRLKVYIEDEILQWSVEEL